MILQALNDYYHRKAADPDPARRLPPFGFEYKEIPFVLELDRSGTLLAVTDTRDDSKKKIAKAWLVPKGIKKTSGIAANLLWDTAEYAVGLDSKGKPERVQQQHAAFLARIDTLGSAAAADEGIRAVLTFLGNAPVDQLSQYTAFELIREVNPLLTFRLKDDVDLICQRPMVSSFAGLQDQDQVSADAPMCLITGEQAESERLHAAIKNVWGAQTSGANIVSFNLDAFSSYGKVQGGNAPVSEKAAFAYVTALNHLLGRGSRQRIQVGDASTVFWSQTDAGDIEGAFAALFGEGDDPDERAEQIRAMLDAVHAGKFNSESGEGKFFVLGLAPNAARIAVRFWKSATLREIATSIASWFDDLRMIRGPSDPEHPSLFRLLTAIAVLGKADNIPPNLGGDLMRSILDGSPFPTTWLNAAVQRSRAERKVSYLRAAAMRACLNRQIRTRASEPTEKEFQPMLDPDNTNTAYRLGRLFATLEKIQEEVSPGLNATIRDRYYGAASSTPVAVFTTLIRLKNAHLKNLSKARAIWFEQIIGSIFSAVSDFPRHLTLPDQARFALGYYHQRQHFFTKKTDPAATVPTTPSETEET